MLEVLDLIENTDGQNYQMLSCDSEYDDEYDDPDWDPDNGPDYEPDDDD